MSQTLITVDVSLKFINFLGWLIFIVKWMKYQHFHFCVLQIFMLFQLFDFLWSCVFHFLDLSFLGTLRLQFWTLWAPMWPPLAPIWPPLGYHFGPLGPFGLACGPPWATTWCLWVPLVRFWALRFPIWATFEAFKSQLGHVRYILNKTHIHVPLKNRYGLIEA